MYAVQLHGENTKVLAIRRCRCFSVLDVAAFIGCRWLEEV